MLLRGKSHSLALLGLVVAFSSLRPAAAGSPVSVVVSFSILADIAHQIGGEDIAVTSLIGPDSDAHVFEPRPEQAKLLAKAQLVVVNGLGLEGWLTRLTGSAQYRGPVVAAAEGIVPIATTEPGATTRLPDPHAWQDARNVAIYADNIARALIGIDPAHSEAYRERLRQYKAALEALDRQVRAAMEAIPVGQRRVITSHAAFAYYGKAYGVTFLAAEGITTDSEPSAKTIADLIRQIRREKIKALFVENISDPRLVKELARDTGATLGPRLYSDALSSPDGPAPTYIRMIQSNTASLIEGMLKN